MALERVVDRYAQHSGTVFVSQHPTQTSCIMSGRGGSGDPPPGGPGDGKNNNNDDHNSSRDSRFRRSRSRSPPRRRRRSRSRSRSRSPGFRRRRSPPRRYRGRSRSRSFSPSPPHGGRHGRDRDRSRGPRGNPGHGGREEYGRDYGPPRGSHGEHHDSYGPGSYGPSRGGGGHPPPRRGGDRRRGEEGPPGVSLLVRNVSPDITTGDLQRAFGKIGEVRDVYIPRDYHSQQPKGFAFIEYADPEMAREARDEMDRFRIKGRELEVVFAQERRKSPNEMKVRGGNPGDSGRGGGNFERSSSFERHQQRRRDDKRNREREQRGNDEGRHPEPKDDRSKEESGNAVGEGNLDASADA